MTTPPITNDAFCRLANDQNLRQQRLSVRRFIRDWIVAIKPHCQIVGAIKKEILLLLLNIVQKSNGGEVCPSLNP